MDNLSPINTGEPEHITYGVGRSVASCCGRRSCANRMNPAEDNEVEYEGDVLDASEVEQEFIVDNNPSAAPDGNHFPLYLSCNLLVSLHTMLEIILTVYQRIWTLMQKMWNKTKLMAMPLWMQTKRMTQLRGTPFDHHYVTPD